MELLIIITMLSIFFVPCASQQIDLHLQHSLQPQENGQQVVSLTTLPRKLKLTEQVQENEGIDFTSYKKQQKEKLQISVKQEQKKQSVVIGGKGETGDDHDPSQYFTMDYSRARRGRRPIHNKHLPVAP
ncbi:hypothetical protein L6164_026992 [Bauhinia variegata]|uniref:Uncharacterized protein n=1 Tax=Bauhinia variegata TaxID=167791 RepID=A0ACB9LRZ1_BAUVA|nr:hypothetical protein L6164_026992 [Bauhinia variegata]